MLSADVICMAGHTNNNYLNSHGSRFDLGSRTFFELFLDVFLRKWKKLRFLRFHLRSSQPYKHPQQNKITYYEVVLNYYLQFKRFKLEYS